MNNLGANIGKHYEKVILSVILLALLATAALLPPRVAQNRETIRQALELDTRISKKAPKPVDTEPMEQALRRVRTDSKIDLSGDHNLFNPVVWKRTGDGPMYKVVKGDEDGPGGLTVTAIRPLEFKIEFDGTQRSGESLRYRFLVTDETKGRGAPRQHYVSVNAPNKRDPFKLTKVNGPEENPESVEIVLSESTTTATLTRENSFKRVAGYEADLIHEKLQQRFNNVRAKQSGGIRLATQTYNIVAITKDEVTVESSNHKRWTVRLKGTP